MPVEIVGFAQALVRCLDFQSVDASALEGVLADANEPLALYVAERGANHPLIQSGSAFEHLAFVQQGVVVPWQFPHSELAAPFLIGEHEFLMGASRWVGSYSAVTEVVIVGIPVSTMKSVTDCIPSVRERMHKLVMRRLARFYWTSLAITGTPPSRVAAALVSRLALDDEDFGTDRWITVKQKDLMRLTAMSRSAVADGLAELSRRKAVELHANGRPRFAGHVLVPDVERLKSAAFTDVLNRMPLQLLHHDTDL